MHRILAILAIVVLGSLLSRSSFAAKSLRLRVVTYNIWGLPIGSRLKARRIARIGPALASLRPQVVLLQEAWLDSDAATILRELALSGLRYSRRFTAWPATSGLAIASVYPLDDETFTAFSYRGRPQRPLHADWLATKGLAHCQLKTPVGPVTIATTHLHARYGSSAYEAIQITQAIELAEALGLGTERFSSPVILGGDVNTAPPRPTFALLTGLTWLVPVDGPFRADWFFHRNGSSLAVRCLRAEKALGTPIDFGTDGSAPLSDHRAVVADFELTAATGGAPPQPLPQTVLDEAVTVLAAETKASEERQSEACLFAAILLVLAVIVASLALRRRGTWTLRCAAAFVALLLAAFVFCCWLAFVHEAGARQTIKKCALVLTE